MRWYRAVLVAAFGFYVLLGVVILSSATENPAALLYIGVGLVAMGVVAARSLRSATIEFRDDEVVLYGLLRNKRITWARVRDVGVTRGTSAALLPWRVPYFELEDGSKVRADDIRSLREPSIVDDVVVEARRRLEH